MHKFSQASLCGFLLVMSFFCTAFAQEDLTITTYYPSPNGVYDNLTVTNSMAIGTGSRGTLDTWAGGGSVAGVVLTQGVTAGYYFGARDLTGNTFAWYSPIGSEARLWRSGGSGDLVIVNNAGRLTTAGSVLQFRNPAAGRPNGCVLMSYGSAAGRTSCPPGFSLDAGLSPAVSSSGGVFWCCQ